MWYVLYFLTNACVFVFLWQHSGENGILLRSTQIVWGLNFALSLHISISFALLYSSPHSVLNATRVQRKSHALLNCARYQIPHLSNEWHIIDACLTQVEIYNVTNARIPYFRKRTMPTAFVYPGLDNTSIFVTSDYQRLSLYERALTLIHECAHIGLGAVDHAYHWQSKYTHLTKEEHYQNADSFMDAVLNHCY